METIALFPIPNSVCFPGTVFPLHVFEPRYRTMIKHCLDERMLLGICHTKKRLSQAKPDQDIKEALQSNQATYKPLTIFSAGHCQLMKTLEDGRLYLNVNMEARYRLVNEVQTLPFSIYECECFDDVPGDFLEEMTLFKEKILVRLLSLTSRIPDVQERLKSLEWQTKDPLAFSFEIFGMLQFDADLQQEILEMTNPVQRLEFLLDLLNSATY